MFKKILVLVFCLFWWAPVAQGQGLQVQNVETAKWPLVSLSLTWPSRDEVKENWFLRLPNGQEIPATSLTIDISPDDDRYSLVVALDTSKSLTKENLDAAKESLIRFSQQLNPADQLALVAFNDSVQLASGFSSNRADFGQVVKDLDLSGSKTELYKALMASFDLLKNIRGRRELLVLSDGVDEGVTVSQLDVLSSAVNNKIRILAIWLAQPQADERHRRFMEKLAAESGGRFWEVQHPESLSMAIYDVLKDKAAQTLPPVTMNIAFTVQDFSPETTQIETTLVRKVGAQSSGQALTLNVPQSSVKAPEPEPAPTPEPTPTPEPAPTPETGPGDGPTVTPDTPPTPEEGWLASKYRERPLTVILTIVGALLFIVILVVALWRKKKTPPVRGTEAIRPDSMRDRGRTVRMDQSQGSVFALEFAELHQRFPLKMGTVTLGAVPGNDIVIDIATVSGRHAEFVVTASACRIKDLNSTNGTLVNGTRINQFMVLQIGDMIKFGSATATLIRNNR
ncbi:MAG: FHA domain-containing protein [Deltaproteobacteria bacterium]|jgi:Mg-chelatase subunit ChlD|nr:FHA domain-containing protein [Deltaproteobacteria bacterium]